MKDSYIQNTDISFLNKKLDNHIQRKIHALYNRKEFQECSLMNMWVVDYLFHMELNQTPIFQKDIEVEFSINRATASKMLTLMEKKKLIKRTSYASDSRLKQIELEPYGMELQKMCCYIREEIENQLTACLTEEEEQIFKTLYLRILTNM
ncbi:MarR family winged helix-turn-helix transcriptional regulator [Blautia sp.]|uniref:MarR family winged helix-turn-helix transcriptional regulator n=1 Tax=Blautia sp. TaxID=1955243 RepID=UPI003AB250DE